jgi:hypothetical protein
MPVVHRDLTGDDCRAFAVPVVENLEQIAPGRIGQRRHGQIVHHQHVGFGPLREQADVASFAVSERHLLAEAWHAQVGGSEALAASQIGQCAGQPAFAEPRFCDDDQVLMSPDPLTGQQARKQCSVEPTWMPVVDILRHSFWVAQFSAAQPRCAQTGLPLGRLSLDEQAKPLLKAELHDTFLRLLFGERRRHAKQAQFVESFDGRMM